MDYVYDLAGKIKQVTDPTGSYGFAYDNMGRLIRSCYRRGNSWARHKQSAKSSVVPGDLPRAFWQRGY